MEVLSLACSREWNPKRAFNRWGFLPCWSPFTWDKGSHLLSCESSAVLKTHPGEGFLAQHRAALPLVLPPPPDSPMPCV